MIIAPRPGHALSIVLILLGLGMTVVAHAACPALDMENNTWMGVLAMWKKRGLSPDQVEAFIRQGVVPRYPITLSPPSGPAPLAVGVTWPEGRDRRVQRIEVDFDGDGVIDVADTRDENLGHVYQTARDYAATIRVHEPDGRVTTYAAPITVLTPAAFDAELQGRWAALKEALLRGNLLEALECIYSMARSPRHESLLRDVLRGRVDEYLPPIRFVQFLVTEARYQSIRPRPGATRLMEVRFHPDLDGVWRVISILPEVAP